jgi:hypothetical protein
MTQTRIVVVALILVGVLYVVATGLAVRNNRSGEGLANRPTPDAIRNFEPPAVLEWLGSWNFLTAKLDRARLSVQPDARGLYVLQRGSTMISVRSDSSAGDDDYQTARLSAVSGTLEVAYVDRCARDQRKKYTELKAPTSGQRSRPVSLAVCGRGGEIHLDIQSADAQVRLE